MALDSSVDELTSVVVRVRGLLLPERDAQEAVAKLARAANHLIESAVGAGVSLLDDQGRRLSTASTDTVTEAADAVQYRLGEGPCLTAWAKQEPQQVDDTLDDPRWPRWTAAAAEMGIRSVVSIPLSYGGRSTGAIKVYSSTPHAFGDTETKLLELLADAAATLLGAAQPVDAPVRLSDSLQSVLQSRETITLATGILMARRNVDAAAARALMVEQARAEGRPMVQVAADVLHASEPREGEADG